MGDPSGVNRGDWLCVPEIQGIRPLGDPRHGAVLSVTGSDFCKIVTIQPPVSVFSKPSISLSYLS
jgi:hypothetical protein